MNNESLKEKIIEAITKTTINPFPTLRRETTLCLRPERHSRNDHFGNFTTSQKTQRQKIDRNGKTSTNHFLLIDKRV